MKPSFYSAKSDRRYASLEGGRRYSTCLAKRKRRVRSVCELSDDEDPGQQFDDDIVLTTPTTDKNALVKSKNSKTLKKRKQQTTLFFPTVKQPDRHGNGTQIRKYGKSVQKIHDKRAKPLKRSVPKKSRLEQTFLDLGQKNFDLKTCKLCGMMYAPGKREDEKIHSKVCKTLQKQIK